MMTEPEYDLRQGCVLGIALCAMIIEHDLWPDIDADSLEEFKESVESMHDYCLEAVRRHDAELDITPGSA
jgi:hypothetical protein